MQCFISASPSLGQLSADAMNLHRVALHQHQFFLRACTASFWQTSAQKKPAQYKAPFSSTVAHEPTNGTQRSSLCSSSSKCVQFCPKEISAPTQHLSLNHGFTPNAPAISLKHTALFIRHFRAIFPFGLTKLDIPYPQAAHQTACKW